jgi:hypothetical protein
VPVRFDRRAPNHDRLQRLRRSRGEATEDEHREVDIGDSGELIDRQDSTTRHRSEARFDYEYDDRGNWVKKAVEGGSIERRTLVYYD